MPPFEQLRVATILQSEGHEVVFADAQAEQLSIEEVVSRIQGAVLLIISSSVMTINSDAKYVARLKERIPGLIVAAYGSHPTFRPEDTLKKGIDFAVQREPEWVLRDLAEALSAGKPEEIYHIKGLAFFQKDSSLKINPHYPYIEDLDAIPPVNISFLPKGVEYFNPIVRNLPYITVSTSHGCPGKCSFCTAPFFHGAKIRMQSAKKVLDDIGYYLKAGIKELYFRDETFTADKSRVISICEGILERGYRFSWICNSRVDTINEETLRLMKKTGCHLIKFGVESGNQEVLTAAGKGITLEQTRTAFNLCRKIGINTHAHLMLGMPGETEDSLNDTLKLALEIKPTTVTFGICTPYPGTPLFKKVLNQDSSIGDGSVAAAMESLHVEGEFNHLYSSVNSAMLKHTLKKFYRRFYLRPGYLLRSMLRIRNRNMLRNAIIGGLNVFSFSTNKKEG
ncbi:MAG: radical SAM protein [Nitrospirae bacterium]|nr:radical SAM protein [Nitrospirota bacterium]